MASEVGREVTGLGQGAHLCTVHEGMAEQIAVAVPFVKEGLARGERCVCIGEESTAQELTRSLSAAGVEVARELDRGALQFVTSLEVARLSSGEFDPGTLIDFIRQTEARAISDGFPGLRVDGDMTWAIGLGVPPDRLVEFEILLDQFLKDSRSVVICQYDRSRFEPALIIDVLRAHPVAVIGDLVCPNPYYDPPVLLLREEPEGSSRLQAARVEWWITQLKGARAAEQERLLERLRLQIDRLPLGYIHMDAEARVLEWNLAAEKLFGYTKKEAMGRSILDLIVPPPLRERLQEVIRRIQAGDMNAHSVNENRTSDGRIITCEWFNTPLFDPDIGFAGFISLAQDVTKQKQTEAELREHAERLRVLARRVVEVQEQERRHLSRELHDQIGQALTMIGINLQVIQRTSAPESRARVEDCLGVVRQTIEQVRTLALDLRPSMIDDLGLAAALRWLVDQQARRAGLVPHSTAQSSGVPLHPDVATACFRVAQEALTNVLRHAQAKNVWVELREGVTEVLLAVRDDGVGFNPQEARRRADRGGSLGLLGIQERVEMLGGRVAIESEPGHGTTVSVRFPAASMPASGEPGEGGRPSPLHDPGRA
jgi:PAS domain S-box-containing protein